MNQLNELSNLLPAIATVFGIAAFIVSFIVELTKEVWLIKKIPTKTWTMIVSIVLCIPAYFAYATYAKIAIEWYHIFAVFVASLAISYITTHGWDTFNELWKRFKK
ncbi:MAG: ribonuclease [Herbinix sp.]|jgi:uncharacterized membrane protein|nr:ribonuclease [Herbinix sp.]